MLWRPANSRSRIDPRRDETAVTSNPAAFSADTCQSAIGPEPTSPTRLLIVRASRPVSILRYDIGQISLPQALTGSMGSFTVRASRPAMSAPIHALTEAAADSA